MWACDWGIGNLLTQANLPIWKYTYISKCEHVTGVLVIYSRKRIYLYANMHTLANVSM